MANTPFTKLFFSSVLFMPKVEIWCQRERNLQLIVYLFPWPCNLQGFQEMVRAWLWIVGVVISLCKDCRSYVRIEGFMVQGTFILGEIINHLDLSVGARCQVPKMLPQNLPSQNSNHTQEHTLEKKGDKLQIILLLSNQL